MEKSQIESGILQINQFTKVNDTLDDFFDIKKQDNKNKSFAYRFFRYVLRPIRFVIRHLKDFLLIVFNFVLSVFKRMFLIKDKDEFSTHRLNKNVLLIKGEWGVGKTYLVEEYFLNNFEAKQRFEPVFIDLFGLSSIDELNKKVLKSVSFSKNKKKEKSIKIYAKATLENKLLGLSASLEIGIILSKKIEKIKSLNRFIEEENSIYNTHKYRYYKEPVIILDDIERKNKDLSLEAIIGFVDIFKKQGIKVILIANATQLEIKEKEMYHLLDRVVDKTCYIFSIDSSICSFIEYFQTQKVGTLSNQPYNILTTSKAEEYICRDLTCNLRTLKRFADIIIEFGRELTYSDRTLLNTILLCLINQCEGKYLFNDLISYKTKIEMEISKIGINREQNYGTTYSKMLDKYEYLKNDKFEVFYLQIEGFIKRFNTFETGGREFVKFIYDCIETGQITLLKNTTFNYEKCPLKNIFNNQALLMKIEKNDSEDNLLKNLQYIKELSNVGEISKVYLMLYLCQHLDLYISSFGKIEDKASNIARATLDFLIQESVLEFCSKKWKYANEFIYAGPDIPDCPFASKNIIKEFFIEVSDYINNTECLMTEPEQIEFVYKILSFENLNRDSVIECVLNINDSFFDRIFCLPSTKYLSDLISFTNYSKDIFDKLKRIAVTSFKNGKLSKYAVKYLNDHGFELNDF